MLWLYMCSACLSIPNQPNTATLTQLKMFEVLRVFLTICLSDQWQTGECLGNLFEKQPLFFYCSVLVTLLEWKWHTSASRWWLLKRQSRFAAGFRAQEVFGFVHWKQPCMDVEPVWWQCWTHRVGIAWRCLKQSK